MFRHPFFKPSGLQSVALHAMDAKPIEALAHRLGMGQFESFKKTKQRVDKVADLSILFLDKHVCVCIYICMYLS